MIKFENPKNGRYYYLSSHKDMLDDHILTIVRGGINYNTVRNSYFSCPKKIEAEIQKLCSRRIKRGYVLLLKN